MTDRSSLRIRPAENLRGTVVLPGDKSLSHRALLFASLGEGISRIDNCLAAGVTSAMMDCLRELGVEIESSAESPDVRGGAADVVIHGRGLRGLAPPSRPLNCRGSATTMRLMAGVLAGQPFQCTLDGNARLRVRPMDRVVDPLRAKGAHISARNGNAPLTFYPSNLRSSSHVLPVASAQVKSALLLAGLFCKGSTTVSEPHSSRDHTERMLRSLGANLEEWDDDNGHHVVRLLNGVDTLPPMKRRLPSDPSSAAFMLVAGSIVPNAELAIPGVCVNPGRTGLLKVLESMGAAVEINAASSDDGIEPVADLTARRAELRGVTVGDATVPAMIDEFPIFAVAATQAGGTTVVRDAQELRLKESDRIDAVCEELNKLGAGIEPRPDGFVVEGPVRLKGTVVNGRGDHRLAMSLAIAGLVAEGETIVQGSDIIRDSFPEFPTLLRRLGADVEW